MEETRRSLENEMASPVSLPDGPDRSSVGCVCLVVMDGWGIAPPGPSNAIALARTPVFDELWATYPHAALSASGPSVGLPDGQMGNSEVGHLTLGAGAVVPQTLTRDRRRRRRRRARDATRSCATALTATERVHLLGMVSDGGVHSGFEHLHALIELAGRACSVPDLVLHCFTDGRDTSPTAGEGYLSTLEDWCRDAGDGPRGERRRALLRDGPRPALGAYPGGVRPARPRTGRAPGRPTRPRPRAPPTSAARPTSSSPPRSSAKRAGSAPATACCASTSALTGCARSCARSPSPASGKAPRTSPGGAGAVARQPVRRLATMTEYQHGWPYPVAFTAQHIRRPRSARLYRGAGEQPAARGRDREVRPRHVLLQRRRGATVLPESVVRWCPRSATSPPTTSSRR